MRRTERLLIAVSIIVLSYDIGLSKNEDYRDSVKTSPINSQENSMKEIRREESRGLEVIEIKSKRKEFSQDCITAIFLKNHSDKLYYEHIIFVNKRGSTGSCPTIPLIKPNELKTVKCTDYYCLDEYDPATMIYSFREIKESVMVFDPPDKPSLTGKNRMGDLEILGWRSFWGQLDRVNFEVLVKNHSDSIVYKGVTLLFEFYDKNDQPMHQGHIHTFVTPLVPGIARLLRHKELSRHSVKFTRVGVLGFPRGWRDYYPDYYQYRDSLDINVLEARIVGGYDFEREKEQEDAIVKTEGKLDRLKSVPYAYQGSLFLNNLYGERTVDIYVTVFEKDHKISQIILKVYNYQGIINFLAYAPQIDFPRYPDKPYPQSGLITCLALELRGELPTALKKPQYPNTWREYVFHYGLNKCTERPQKFPSISDILSGKAKLRIRLGGHAFTIDNLKKLPQK